MMFGLFRRRAPLTASPARASSFADADGLVDPEVMDQISHLDFLSRSVVDGLLAGKHRSTTKGGCSEFAQHRQYAAGDEVRQIDWQVYARNDRYFIKQFEEETNLQALVAVDTSGSMRFGLSTVSKLDHAKRTAACLCRLLLHQRDAVGLTLLHQARTAFIPPRQHAAHLQAILAALQMAEASDACELGTLIQQSVLRMRRRGLFVLLSDCFLNLDELATALRIVKARGHDVVVMHVMAPEELAFDFRRWSWFRSLETPHERVRIDPPAVRTEYLKRVQAFLESLENLVIGLGGDYVRMSTHQDLAESLGWFLRTRLARRGGGGR